MAEIAIAGKPAPTFEWRGARAWSAGQLPYLIRVAVEWVLGRKNDFLRRPRSGLKLNNQVITR
ncbi:hypothetical protein [Pseudomonas sp. MPB26]|uniref:hypothetical protein n=1 Tax=Pseudomonas sp. MPB26 TaxID=3388491 RepID=UPI003984A891